MQITSSALFLIGLICAAIFAVSLDQAGQLQAFSSRSSLFSEDRQIVSRAGQNRLTDAEEHAARVAWSYLSKNTRPGTGLVDSVEGFPSTTLWDQGSYLLGLVSAVRLGVIDEQEFDTRASLFLSSLAKLRLYDDLLPNKAYNTVTLEMTDYGNNVVSDGIGWSALDMARLFSALRILQMHYPRHTDAIEDLFRIWKAKSITSQGELVGTARSNGETVYLQEGRLGYEQYGARAAALWGLDTSQAMTSARILKWREINSVDVPTDRRTSATFGAITPILSEPYFLMALELGIEGEFLVLASQIYRAQQARFEDTGILTMVSEDHVDAPVSFLYSSVFSNGREWAVVTEDGHHYPEFRTISTKAAFAWNAIFDTDYLELVMENIWDLGDPDRGWAAGRYEVDNRPNSAYTLNTNAIILESLHYSVFGPLSSI